MFRFLLPLFFSAYIAYPVAAQMEPPVSQPTTSGVGVGEAAEPGRGSLSPGGRQVTPLTGLVTIESDLQKADNSTGVVTATGNVRILYPDRGVVATARQAQYYSKEGRVVLSGDVDIIQDNGNSLRAERIVYLVERERIIADPAEGQQVIIRYYLNSPVGAGMGVLDGQKPPRP